MTEDNIFINRCIHIAQFAEGKTAPNPMVGAVIVHNGKVIGEGYHKRCGEPHAEINAIASVKDKSLLKESTLYVNLEPCSYYGKTPPCADAIIQHGIPKVVIGMLDVNPKVQGNGIRMLQDAGIDVVSGIMDKECKYLNRRFITFFQKKRPYIILKWAQTADGFIDINRENKETSPLKISNATTKTLNHQIRSHESSICVATNTVILDNPHLTITKWQGENPVRIIVDRSLKIPSGYNMFNDKAITLIFNENTDYVNGNIEYIKIDFGMNIIPQILDILYEKNIQSMIVEGGSMWLNSFICDAIWDEAYIEISSHTVAEGVNAPVLTNGILFDTERIGHNTILRYKNKSNGLV